MVLAASCLQVLVAAPPGEARVEEEWICEASNLRTYDLGGHTAMSVCSVMKPVQAVTAYSFMQRIYIMPDLRQWQVHARRRVRT